MTKQMNLLELTPAEATFREFEEGDLVSGVEVTKTLDRGDRITGTIIKIGNKYLILDTGNIFKDTAEFNNAQQTSLPFC